MAQFIINLVKFGIQSFFLVMHKRLFRRAKLEFKKTINYFALSLLFLSNPAFSTGDIKCLKNDNSIIEKLIIKINSYEHTELNLITCKEIDIIKGFNEDKLLVTTGRKRGRYSICLSNTKDNPCKFILGYFKKNGIPSEMLSKLFEIEFSQDGELNETVERLFLEPSSLIR